MIRKPIKRSVLLEEFRADRGQTTAPPVSIDPRPRKPRKTVYSVFLDKYNNLTTDFIEGFTTQDLVFYFSEVAKESGFRYTVPNMKKDLAIMSRVKENYTNQEICAMIEFLYHSDQDYLSKAHLSPNVLVSRWVNTIFADTQRWLYDQYETAEKQEKHKRKKKLHEWDSSAEDGGSKIGVKL